MTCFKPLVLCGFAVAAITSSTAATAQTPLQSTPSMQYRRVPATTRARGHQAEAPSNAATSDVPPQQQPQRRSKPSARNQSQAVRQALYQMTQESPPTRPRQQARHQHAGQNHPETQHAAQRQSSDRQLHDPHANRQQVRSTKPAGPSKNASQRPVQQAAFQEPMISGDVIMEGPGTGPGIAVGEPYGDDFSPGFEPDGCGATCSTGCCDPCCNTCGPDACHTIWENLQLFGGVQGFESPVDQGVNGNFGFHEGANWGGPVFEYGGMGGQVGVRVLQSDIADSYALDSNRHQMFFTAGLFHRPFDNDGWQGGVAFDWLHDDFYVQMNVTQLRAEISWINCGCFEIGGWAAVATSNSSDFSEVNNGDVNWEPIDQYAMFYRRYFANGGNGRFSAGATGEGQGLLAGDITLPVTQNWAVVGNATYMIGSGDSPEEEARSEAWGLTMSLVWYPGYKSPCSSRNPYRPLFGVADNTTMLLNFKGDHID